MSTLFHHDSAVANIARYADPGCRLVVVLRDPVERAFSSYLYLLARGYETAPTFEDALAAEPDRAAWHHLWHYEAMSHYGPQLQAFVDGFGRDALYVFTHEQLRSDRAGTLRGLCDWLDLEPGPVLADQAEVNIGGVPRSSLLQGAVHRARGSVLKPIVKRLTSRRLRERVRTANLDRPTLDPALRASLWPRFADDVAVVETLLGRPVSEWTASGTN